MERIIRCFEILSKLPCYRNKWVSDTAWVSALNRHFLNLNVNKRSFNVSFDFVNPFKGSVDTFDRKMNPSGLFRWTINRRSNVRLIAYYVTNKGTVALDHHDGWEGWDTLYKAI